MNDPQTWTTVWELIVGAGGEMSEGGQRGKNWDNCNRMTIKMILKIEKKYFELHFLSFIIFI